MEDNTDKKLPDLPELPKSEKPEPEKPEIPTPEPEKPETPEPEKSNDDLWAETLGIDFDESKIPTPPPAPEQNQPAPPPFAAQPQPYYQQAPAQAPQGPVRDEDKVMPPSYLLWAILSCIVCCVPTGIVAIIYSSSVSTKYFSRDYEGARRASRLAQIWIIVSIVAGIIFGALYVPLAILTQ